MPSELSAAWHRLAIAEQPPAANLPDERATTGLHTPVYVEFLGERKRLTYAADARLPRDCVHTLACAAELSDLVEPVSGTRAIAFDSADVTRDLGPVCAAAPETAARHADPVPIRQNDSAVDRCAGSAISSSLVEADDAARATAVSGQSGGRLVAGGGGLALVVALCLSGCAAGLDGGYVLIAFLITLAITRNALAAAMVLLLAACVPPERSLVRCRDTSTHFDGDGGAIAWAPSGGAVFYSLDKPAFLACDTPSGKVCTVLPTFACTVERLP